MEGGREAHWNHHCLQPGAKVYGADKVGDKGIIPGKISS